MENIEEHQKKLDLMCNDEFSDQLSALLRSRCHLIYIACPEEGRLLEYFRHLSIVKGYTTKIWDCYRGLLDLMTGEQVESASDDIMSYYAVLDLVVNEANNDKIYAKALREQKIRGKIYILLDFHHFLEDAEPELERRLKTFDSIDSMTHIVMVGHNFSTTRSLENSISVLDFPYPNEKEIEIKLDTLISEVEGPAKIIGLSDKVKGRKHQIIESANGLTIKEARMAFSKSLVMHKDFDVKTILSEKKQIIRKRGILEYFEPKFSMNDIGGLHNLVSWLHRRKASFSEDASEYGLPSPKGIMLLGVPGCGKSLCAKAVSSLYEMPLLRLDFGKLFGSLVGESESTTREAIKLADALAPCIVWIDEIEKGVSGSRNSGLTDGGTTSRVLSTFLTWQQERESNVFLFCTANDYSTIPPEFMRAGRFDEIFFVDLPSLEERKEIYNVLLKRYKRNADDFDIKTLAKKSKYYSGAEIEKSIVMALYIGFNDNRRKISTDDILYTISNIVPLYKMREDDFVMMRDWAKEKCVFANSYSDLN